jgi:hypothetical protein
LFANNQREDYMNIVCIGLGLETDKLSEILTFEKEANLYFIEPIPSFIPYLQSSFPTAHIVNKAIIADETIKYTNFYYSYEDSPNFNNSSIHKDFLLAKGFSESSIQCSEIEAITINKLLSELNLERVDYLYFNVGGIEENIVLDFNHDKFDVRILEFNPLRIKDESENIFLNFNKNAIVQDYYANPLFSENRVYRKMGKEVITSPSIDIILRTHSFIDIHPNPTPRYCGADKTTLIEKCVKSLVQSANKYDGKIKFIWFDDHSSQDMIDRVFAVFSKSKHEVEFHPLEQRGWNASGLAQFDAGRGSSADLVYFVEDDYLHYPTAIEEMVNAYRLFKRNLGTEVAIHPYDDPDNYLPLFIDECRVVLGKNRHWRTNKYSTFTFMCNPEIVRKFWSRFYTVATEYMTEWGEKNEIQEGTTINHIWRWEVKLFTPIPSVALHMGYERQLDPFIDWKSLWDSVG